MAANHLFVYQEKPRSSHFSICIPLFPPAADEGVSHSREESELLSEWKFILSQNLNISIRIFCSAGLIVEKTSNYVCAFYMTGGVLFVAFLIPMVLIVISRKRSRVSPMDPKETAEAVVKV